MICTTGGVPYRRHAIGIDEFQLQLSERDLATTAMLEAMAPVTEYGGNQKMTLKTWPVSELP